MNPRERIIQKALLLFYQQGVNTTGINQIIAESRVAKASFYNHFPSKDDLIAQCIEEYCIMVQKIIKKIFNRSASFNDFINKWTDFLLTQSKEKNYNGCPVANIAFAIDCKDKKYKNKITQTHDTWIAEFSEIIKNARKNKEIKSSEPDQKLAQRFFHFYEGALTMWKMTGTTIYIEDLKSLYNKMLF
jgi:AcrR family transcriptional regulator